jgi:hypothetical protein
MKILIKIWGEPMNRSKNKPMLKSSPLSRIQGTPKLSRRSSYPALRWALRVVKEVMAPLAMGSWHCSLWARSQPKTAGKATKANKKDIYPSLSAPVATLSRRFPRKAGR